MFKIIKNYLFGEEKQEIYENIDQTTSLYEEGLKMGGVPIKDIRELIVEFISTLPDPSQSCFYCKEKNVSKQLERGEEYICDECYKEQDVLMDLEELG